MKNSLLRSLWVGCGLVAVHAGAADASYNVLFIVSDDMRPDLGCYGNAEMKTPNLDQLAERGMVFTRAYCQVAVCNPSRVSVLGGVRAATSGIYDQTKYLRPEMPDILTLPQLFKDHGYRTLSIGKVYHDSVKEPGNDPLSWSEPQWGFGKPYRHWHTQESADMVARMKQLPEAEQPKHFRGPPYEAANMPDEAYPDGMTASMAIDALNQVKDQPFFLAVGFIKPHLPFTCPQKYWDLYPEDSIEFPENASAPKNVPPAALQSGYELRSYGGVPPEGEIPREMAINLIRGYRATVSFVDAQIGRVLDELERLGLDQNTIIVFWGDHGYHLLEQGLWTKMTNFEVATRSPLIISVPGQPTAGEKSNALVELIDIYPTLVELEGFTMPEHLEGTSLVPLLEDPDRPWKTAVFSEYGRGKSSSFDPKRDPLGTSMRTDRYRYTEWKSPQGEIIGRELYDYQEDPLEEINMADVPGNESLVAELATQMDGGWRAALPPKSED